jgi:iron complex outermembrane receptor protein
MRFNMVCMHTGIDKLERWVLSGIGTLPNPFADLREREWCALQWRSEFTTHTEILNIPGGEDFMRSLRLASFCSIIALASTAHAQPAVESQPDKSIVDSGEIVVTAQKREERLSDVGLTIVAANATQLKTAGVFSAVDLPRIAPGVTTAPTFSGAYVFSIRGIGFNASQLSAPPAVSLYLDEAPLPYSAMSGGALLDVERVEVLKGPQGTLFGQNATGGSINIIMAKPTSQPSAGANLEVNNFGQVFVEGFVSGPISDTVRARLAVSTTQFGTWQRNYIGPRLRNGDENRLNGRAIVEWTPTERLKVTATVNAGYDHGEVIQPQLSRAVPVNPATAPPGLLTLPLPNGARDVDFQRDLDTHKRDRQYQGILRMDLDLGESATLTSISNYVNTSIDEPHDFDSTQIDGVRGTTAGHFNSLSQELRVSGVVSTAKINYVVGVNYQRDRIRDVLVEQFQEYSSLPPGFVLDSRYKLGNRAVGIFANLDAEILPNLTLTGGVRYTETKQTVSGCNSGNAITAGTLGFLASLLRPGVESNYVAGGCVVIDDTGSNPTYLPAFADFEQKEHNIAWRIGANYKFAGDNLLYGLVSRGYKAGVFPVHNILLQSTQTPVTQEKLTSYEVGVKLALLDRRLRLNLAGFYYDYVDKQFFTYFPVPPIGVTAVLRNIPKSTVKGLEAEIFFRPVQPLTLRAAVTYLDTSVGSYIGFNAVGQPVDFKGKEINFSPPWSATFDAEYKAPLAGGTAIYAGLGGMYNSRTFSDLGEFPLTRIPARTILDARVGLESESGWRIGLFVRNLTDKYYWTSVNNGGDTLTRYAGLPRTFGINASVKF